jgi:hypothetical protein
MIKKLFIVGIFVILLMGIASADLVKFDNFKTYDETTKTVTIDNFFGMGGEIAKVKLETPQVNYVMRGKDRLVAEFTINNSEVYTQGVLDKMDFYNVKDNNKSITRTFTYKYKVLSGTKDVNDYKEVCSDITDKNGTKYKSCVQELTGTHKENIYGWKEFNPLELSSFKSGITTIGIYTDVNAGDYVEWVPTLYGVEIKEWAVWADSFNVNLLSYWKLDFANQGNSLNYKYNTTETSITYVPGVKLNSAKFAYDGTSLMNISNSSAFQFGTGSWAINFWANKTTAGAMGYLGTYNPTDTGWMIYSETGTLSLRTGGDISLFGVTPIAANTTYMITLNRNATHYTFFLNGVFESAGASAAALPTNNQVLTFGFVSTGSVAKFRGQLDEIAIWNRSLSATEISTLYDGGTGTFYGNLLPVSGMNVILDSPANNTITSASSLTFVANYSYSNLNISNGTYYIWNADGTTFNKTTLTATATTNQTSLVVNNLIDGVYNWDVYGCGYNATNTVCNWSSQRNWTFTRDGTQPIVTIIFPTNNTNSSNSGLDINYTASDAIALGSCWYSNDSYLVNTTLTNCGTNITTITWTEGIHNVTVWANDSAGNENFASVTFMIDTVIPLINITFPLNNSQTLDINSDINYTRSDINLKSCWYSNDSYTVNTTIADCNNLTSIVWAKGKHNVTIWANDTAGNENFSKISFSVESFIENSQTFVGSIFSGSYQTMKINFSYLPADYIGTSVTLKYNTSDYTASTTDTGDTQVYSATILTPTINEKTNRTFYWEISLYTATDTEKYNSTMQSQWVYPIQADNCSNNSNKLMNLFIVDEDSLALINGTIELAVNIYTPGTTNLIKTYNNTLPFIAGEATSVCISNMTENYTLGYKIKYYGNLSLYYPEYKAIQQMTFYQGETQNITLYDLLRASGYTFTISIRGTTDNQNLLVDVQRQYIPTDNFLSVESDISDVDGNINSHLVDGTVAYNFIVSRNNVVLFSFNNQHANCQSPTTGVCSITLGMSDATATATDFQNYGNISLVYLWNNITRVLSTTFNSIDGRIHNVNERVFQTGNLICNRYGIGLSQTMTCAVPTTYGNDTLMIEIVVDGKLVGTNWITLENAADVFGGTRIIIMLLLYSTLVMLMLASPVLIIIGAILGMVFSLILMLSGGGSTFSTIVIAGWFIAGGIIIAWQIGRRT